jgi:hypothetical protein
MSNRTIVIGGTYLVRGKLQGSGMLMIEICDELEPVLRETGYADSAPFKTVSLIIRYGQRRREFPEYGIITKRTEVLPVTVELEMDMLRGMNRAQLKRQFQVATLLALIDVAKRYRLPHGELSSRLADLQAPAD